ncbi:Glycosyl transferases group 1 [Desulfonatronum thiosulfatophilum]|uniref:Glycosyl transferases group 1 n=1 Tax=Desulfonatronum thiosulfatophilum TaxID=617002 RepID=A0A1G6ELN4_9BACT|nr:glycosyltransferase [Desulfonatronum thiosulfatophilum]SDB57825.1 Glycosyl transferases group 1 [Desulfonatronum thiosulfatophilum]
MRILSVGGSDFVPAWRNMGHDVLTLGKGSGLDVALEQPIGLRELWEILSSQNFRPDLTVWVDRCRPLEVFGLERMPGAVIGFSIDQYCNPWHVPYSWAFDLFLVAQKDYLPLFADHRAWRECRWFPLYCRPDVDRDEGLERDIPVSFVGTLDPPLNRSRRPFLQQFRSRCPTIVQHGAYTEIFNRSMIVLNQSAVGELNFRLFQAAACGAAVLTEDVPNGLRDAFTPDEEILVYPRGNAGEAVRIAFDALSEPERLRKIALQGKRRVLREHSATVRAKEIIRLAEKLLTSRVELKRKTGSVLVREHMIKTYTFLASDADLPLPLDHRQLYIEAARETFLGQV